MSERESSVAVAVAAADDADAASGAPFPTPRTPDELHGFLERTLGVRIARRPLLAGSSAPFDYLVHTFFEGRFTHGMPEQGQQPVRAAPDCVVWANRGGGKTFLGAVATMLDLVFKPGVQVRILGGSLEQSGRMYAHLRRLFEHEALRELVDGKVTEKRIRLVNGSCAEILAQSETAVRGTRVQKVRCDEVELFSRDIWAAAQLTTRSMRLRGPWGAWVRGSIEAASTMHRPMGLMWDLVSDAHRPGEVADAAAPGRGRVLFRWGLVDSLEPCGPEHRCEACALAPECAGRAKGPRDEGHIPVADALAMKARVDTATWEAEMLCLRPRRSHCVLPEFDPEVHCYGSADDPRLPEDGPMAPAGEIVCGMDLGIRAPTVILWASRGEDDVLRIFDEHVREGARLAEHVAQITAGEGRAGLRGWPSPRWVAPDPVVRAKNLQTGKSDAQVFQEAGLTLRLRAMPQAEGLRLVRVRLDPAAGPPRLLVHRRCAHLIESLSRYHYPENRPESLEPVKDGHDHAVDALRYLVVNLDRPYRTRAGSYL
jgi:hypothetical protein